MAKITLAGVDALTESGGVVSLTAAIAVDASNVSGVLPVGVTGGSGLDAVPAPAATVGQILQTQSMTSSLADGTTTTAQASASGGMILGYVEIVPIQTGSAFILSANWNHNFSRVANYQCSMPWLGVQVSSGYSAGSSTTIFQWFNAYEGTNSGSDDIYTQPTHTMRHVPSYTLGHTVSYEMRLGANRGSGSVAYPTVYNRSNTNNPAAQLIVQEIVG